MGRTDSRTDVAEASAAIAEDRYPLLGILPRSTAGRLFFLWGCLNTALALLPVFDVLGNGRHMVAGILPLTVLYGYAVFTLNCVLALVYALVRGRDWLRIEALGDGPPDTDAVDTGAPRTHALGTDVLGVASVLDGRTRR